MNFADTTLELLEGNKWSILIASHELTEMEKLIDTVGYLYNGELRFQNSVETLQKTIKRISFVSTDGGDPKPDALPASWFGWQQENKRVSFFETAYEEDALLSTVKNRFPEHRDLNVESLTLREIYILLTQQCKQNP